MRHLEYNDSVQACGCSYVMDHIGPGAADRQTTGSFDEGPDNIVNWGRGDEQYRCISPGVYTLESCSGTHWRPRATAARQ